MNHGLLVLVLFVFVWVVAGTPNSVGAAILAQSTFDTDTEGWRAFTNAPGFPFVPVTFAPGAGNPGGALRHNAPSDNLTSFFLAPTSFTTALHSAIGGSVSWDVSVLFSPGDVFFGDIDLGIIAGTNRIRQFLTPPAPATNPAYTHFAVDFTAAAGWSFFDGVNTAVATQQQIDAVLAGAGSLFIRAEYFSSTTPDVAFLDNVVVQSAPEPPIMSLFGVALFTAALMGWRSSRRRLRRE